MLVSLDEAKRLIESGKILHIAGDERLLSKLPRGKWIGGSTPFFISEDGGIFTKEKLFINEMDFAEDFRVSVYGKYNIFQFVEEGFDNGLNMVILPSSSDVLKKYAKDAPEVDELLLHPTIGWVSGYDTSEEGAKAYVFDGTTGEAYQDRAVVMFIKLPDNKSANINIINIFSDDKTDSVIRFPFDSFEVNKCSINGYEVNLSEYIEKKKIDTRIPLVTDYNGALLNSSIKSVEDGAVSLYAPVFRDIDYRFATGIPEYEEELKKKLEGIETGKVIFSCNCILNYLYGNLEGRKTPPFSGPVTFGEVAYQLMNQTLVYCEIN